MADAGAVFIVEDDAAVRDSLALLLRLHGHRVQTFACAEDFVASPARRDAGPSCVLIDVRLPGMSGLALQAELARGNRAMPVLVMTAQSDAALVRAALLLGAADFLEKPIAESDLLGAVMTALRIDTDRLAITREAAARAARLDALDARERTLFERVTDGQPMRQISQELRLSPPELERQLQAMMAKLDAHRMADLFRLRLGGVPISSEAAAPPAGA